jgi:hypothetical protein
MSGTHHRTWQQYHVGHVNITVQLDSIAGGRNLEQHQNMASVTRQLIAIMETARIPATWAVSDPAHSAATSLILKSAVDHELAILGDANWVGPTAGRTRFARELVRRVTQARAAGLNVSTLVPGAASIESHIDLVVKHQITAVAGLNEPVASRKFTEPRALHYGVWEVPATTALPLPGTWFSSGKWSLWRSIRRTAKEAGLFHLLIDAAAIAALGRREESINNWLVRRISTLRDRGLVRVETLRTTAARLSDVPAVSPQRSILRSVA